MCNLPLPKMIEFSKLLLMYNFRQNKLPACFANTWSTNRERRIQEERRLRNEDEYFVQLARTKITERMPLYTVPVLWNEFRDQNIKNELNRNNFKKSLKKYFLGNLMTNVICNRLNCPACSVNQN